MLLAWERVNTFPNSVHNFQPKIDPIDYNWSAGKLIDFFWSYLAACINFFLSWSWHQQFQLNDLNTDLPKSVGVCDGRFDNLII